MSDQQQSTVKRRLAGEGRPPPEIGRVTPELALRLALARAGEDCLALELVGKSVEMGRSVLGKLQDDIPDHALMALLGGPQGQLGLMVLDAQMVAALIEKQTTGRVVPSATASRAPTRTDAVMCTDLINAVLGQFQNEAQEAGLSLSPEISGYKYVIPLEDPRTVQMTLEDIAYRYFDVVVDFEKGAKEGRMVLFMPYDLPRRNSAVGEDEPEKASVVADIAMDAVAEMDAVLHRFELPLADVTALIAGSKIPVPREAISRICLEDITGHPISAGQLGAQSGHRAVRVSIFAEGQVGVDPLFGRMSSPSDNSLDPSFGVPPNADLISEERLADVALASESGQMPPFETPSGPADAPPYDMPDLPQMNVGAEGELANFEGLEELPDLAELGNFSSVE